MALQRSAGNAAVLQLLKKDEDPIGGAASQRAGGTPPPRPVPGDVVYVSFQNVAPPAAPDRNGLPSTSASALADRAGRTRVRNQPRMSTAWDTGPSQRDGKVPLFLQSVNVFFRLDPIQVFVAPDYPEDSCPYWVTLEHERGHVRAYLRLFHAARDPLVADLKRVPIPTSRVPLLVAPADVARVQDEIGASLTKVVRDHQARLRQAMEADSAAKDSPSVYESTHRRCPRDEWLSTL